MEEKKEKTLYQKIRDGEVQPEGRQKGWKNLEKRVSFNMMPEEKAREIRRKGAEAIHQLHGEKKTAKQSLERILTLKVDDEILSAADLPAELVTKLKKDNPDATLYDLIQLVAVGRAVSGNMKAYELVRDTHGDKPVEKVDITGDIMTEADRAVLDKISARLQEPGSDLVIVKDQT